jgi:hypothetical protein
MRRERLVLLGETSLIEWTSLLGETSLIEWTRLIKERLV